MAHKGMVHTATFVKEKLEQTGALTEALDQRPDYGLVITGM